MSAHRYTDADRAVVRAVVIPAINKKLTMYRQTGNGAFFWQAWRDLRRCIAMGVELEIPESMLQQVDKMAAALCVAKGQREVAAAVKMTRPADKLVSGGPNGNALTKAQIGRLTRMSALWLAACAEAGTAPADGARPAVSNELMRQVAQQHHKTFGALKKEWSEWWRDAPSEHKAAVLADIMKAWAR